MKGIFILSFHKQPGAFVDREYPEGLTKKLGINKTEQNKIYSLHRMRNTRPNYLFVNVKKNKVASFFSGFDTKQFIGRPNQCVCIALDKTENPTKWEGELRRLVYELLPSLDKVRGGEQIKSGLDEDPRYDPFDEELKDAFNKLRKGEIEPMEPGEGEHLEGDGAVIRKISTAKMEKSLADDQLSEDAVKIAAEQAKRDLQKEQAQEEDEISAATKQMEMMEVESLRENVRNLHKIIKDKDNRINSLEMQLRELKTSGTANSEETSKIRGEYEAIIETKEEELNRWRNKVSELNEELFIKQDNLKKTTEMMMQMTMDTQKQTERIRELKAKLKALEANQGAPKDLGDEEVATLREHMAETEEILKDTTKELEDREKRNRNLFKQTKKSEAKIADLESAIEEYDSKVKDLESRAEEWSQKLGQKDEEIEKLRNKVQSSKDELVSAKRKIKVLRRDIRLASEGKAPSVDSRSSVNLQTLKSELEDYKQENEQLEDKITKLKDKLSQAKSQLEVSKVQSSDRVVQEKMRAQSRNIEDMEQELIKAKKTIKVQHREIKHLKEILEL